jgi:hypothetical protein
LLLEEGKGGREGGGGGKGKEPMNALSFFLSFAFDSLKKDLYVSFIMCCCACVYTRKAK